jgi:hypothetical protein
MAMAGPVTFRIQLEQTPGPHYPYGEFGCRYQLFLPLRPDGRLDPDALGNDMGRYRAIRLRAGDGEAIGTIVPGPRGAITLEYEDFARYPSRLFIGSAPIAPGGSVRVADYDADAGVYRVVSAQPLAVQVQPSEAAL